jgi:hypothetical protein
MCVDAKAMCFERCAHVWIDRSAQRKKPIDGDGVACDTQGEEDERCETSETHNAAHQRQGKVARVLRFAKRVTL